MLCQTNLIKVLKREEGVVGLCVRYIPRLEALQLLNENVVEQVGAEAKAKGFTMSLKNGEDVYFFEGNCNTEDRK